MSKWYFWIPAGLFIVYRVIARWFPELGLITLDTGYIADFCAPWLMIGIGELIRRGNDDGSR